MISNSKRFIQFIYCVEHDSSNILLFVELELCHFFTAMAIAPSVRRVVLLLKTNILLLVTTFVTYGWKCFVSHAEYEAHECAHACDAESYHLRWVHALRKFIILTTIDNLWWASVVRINCQIRIQVLELIEYTMRQCVHYYWLIFH